MEPVNPYLRTADDLFGNMDEEDRRVWAHFLGQHGGEVDITGVDDLILLGAVYWRLTGQTFDFDLGVTNGWARCFMCHRDRLTMPSLRDPAA